MPLPVVYHFSRTVYTEDIMEVLYNTLLFIFAIAMFALPIGLIRPQWVSLLYKPFKKTAISRKFIAATMIPALIVTSGLASAVEPESVKQARRDQQAAELRVKQQAEKQAAEKQQQEKLAKEKTAKIQAEEKTKKEAAAKAKQEAEAKAQKEKEEQAKKEAEQKAETERITKEKEQAEAAERSRQQAAVQVQAAELAAPSPRPTPAPAQATVHAGAYCSPAGATGVFSSGNPAVCAIDSKGKRLRWQSP
jgi:colicin import membrane protein